MNRAISALAISVLVMATGCGSSGSQGSNEDVDAVLEDSVGYELGNSTIPELEGSEDVDDTQTTNSAQRLSGFIICEVKGSSYELAMVHPGSGAKELIASIDSESLLGYLSYLSECSRTGGTSVNHEARLLTRSAFNSDFTLLAVVGQVDRDWRAGVLVVATGEFRDLSGVVGDGSSYGSIADHRPIFDGSDNLIWVRGRQVLRSDQAGAVRQLGEVAMYDVDKPLFSAANTSYIGTKPIAVSPDGSFMTMDNGTNIYVCSVPSGEFVTTSYVDTGGRGAPDYCDSLPSSFVIGWAVESRVIDTRASASAVTIDGGRPVSSDRVSLLPGSGISSSVDSFAVSPDGASVLFRDNGTYWTASVDGGEPERVSDLSGMVIGWE